MPTKKGLGQSFRKGLSLPELVRMFPDDATAASWFADCRWPNGPLCPRCSLSVSSLARPILPCRIAVALAVSSSASARVRLWPSPS